MVRGNFNYRRTLLVSKADDPRIDTYNKALFSFMEYGNQESRGDNLYLTPPLIGITP